MAEKTYKPLLMDSIKAAVNLGKQRFIGFDGNYCGENQKALGVSDVEIEQGQYAPVALNGILLITAVGPFSAGSKVASNSAGYAMAYSTGEFNGYAIDESTAGFGITEVVRIARGI